MAMFRIDCLPAEFGDALWIEYGAGVARHRVLIDCGTGAVYPRLRDRILALPGDQRRFELFVVTHVDVDHIGGALQLLRDAPTLGVSFGEIWFNGYVHLSPGGRVPPPQADDVLGPLQGEVLTELIVASGPQRWNAAAQGRALVVPATGPLPPLAVLPGGLTLTLLSPQQAQLDQLRPAWEAACRKAGIVPGAATAADDRLLDEPAESPDEEDDLLGDPDVAALAQSPFRPDRAKPNGSSIALLAEYAGHRALLAADAHAPVLLDAIARLADRGTGRLRVDAVKLAHHGSRGNTSLDLVRALQCRHWLVSTNGKQFRHPDREAIARVVHAAGDAATLHFNYRTEFNDVWATSGLRRRHGYAVEFPAADGSGISVELAG